MLFIADVYLRDISNMIVFSFAHECEWYECLLFLFFKLSQMGIFQGKIESHSTLKAICYRVPLPSIINS